MSSRVLFFFFPFEASRSEEKLIVFVCSAYFFCTGLGRNGRFVLYPDSSSRLPPSLCPAPPKLTPPSHPPLLSLDVNLQTPSGPRRRRQSRRGRLGKVRLRLSLFPFSLSLPRLPLPKRPPSFFLRPSYVPYYKLTKAPLFPYRSQCFCED